MRIPWPGSTMFPEEKVLHEVGVMPNCPHMLDSWESGDFWVSYAARKSWAFDAVFWTYIDRRFFGDHGHEPGSRAVVEQGKKLLDGTEIQEMHAMVDRKLSKMRERVLAWELETDAKEVP